MIVVTRPDLADPPTRAPVNSGGPTGAEAIFEDQIALMHGCPAMEPYHRLRSDAGSRPTGNGELAGRLRGE